MVGIYFNQAIYYLFYKR